MLSHTLSHTLNVKSHVNSHSIFTVNICEVTHAQLSKAEVEGGGGSENLQEREYVRAAAATVTPVTCR